MNPQTPHSAHKPCTNRRCAHKRVVRGEMAEWFKAAVLKTPAENIASLPESAKTAETRRVAHRVLYPFARNIPAHRAAHMAWRYDEARIQAAKDERERLELIELANSPLSEGLCYFLGNLEYEVVKIGFTKSLSKRMSQLKGASGLIKLTLLATSRGGRGAEAHYHHKFRAHHTGNELFDLHPDILAEIDRLNASPASCIGIAPLGGGR